MSTQKRPDEDFDEEIRSHIDLETGRLVEEGVTDLTLVPKCERALRASHATGARRRSGARERVYGSPRGEAPRLRLKPE
jgi:hypothetical protein